MFDWLTFQVLIWFFLFLGAVVLYNKISREREIRSIRKELLRQKAKMRYSGPKSNK